MNPTALIELHQARVQFGPQQPVFDALDLRLSGGEFLALLGPSGCGKSTVLRVMAGLQPLDGGTVHIRASSPAFVFQEPALMPWADLAHNVELPLRLAGQSAASRAEAVEGVLTRVGLQGRQRALPHELSGGMRMRASIARALVTRPDLLLMDEPFAALDDPTRLRLQDDLLQWWQAERFAVAFVTHQVAEAVFMATRVAVMGAGRLACEVAIDEPFPRGESFRRSGRFHETCLRLGDAMRAAAQHAA